MRIGYSIVFVSDMKRSISFYRDVLEISLKFETSHWSEFQMDGATLALHLSHEPNVTVRSAGMEKAGSCRPGFSVEDLEAFHTRVLDHDVPCVQEPKETFGSRIAQYSDPDGLVFSVSEMKHDR